MSTSHPLERHRLSLDASLLLGVFLLLHALAHGVGVSGNLDRISQNEPAELLGGVWHVSGDTGLAVMAALWAVVGLVTVAAAIEVLRHAPAARTTVAIAAAVSLVLNVVFLWAAVVGVVIDVLLVLAVWLVPDRIGLRRASAR
ncbi:MAG TPA: hypothetical protein VHO29_14545 [Marmoricola sp.]|nr:hypothetical protein [Marmoricola sp.]